jgi:hypothetical protein
MIFSDVFPEKKLALSKEAVAMTCYPSNGADKCAVPTARTPVWVTERVREILKETSPHLEPGTWAYNAAVAMTSRQVVGQKANNRIY